jgi:hypothetical protein
MKVRIAAKNFKKEGREYDDTFGVGRADSFGVR